MSNLWGATSIMCIAVTPELLERTKNYRILLATFLLTQLTKFASFQYTHLPTTFQVPWAVTVTAASNVASIAHRKLL